MDEEWIVYIAESITAGCQKAGSGDFTTQVTIERSGVTFTFPLYVPKMEAHNG